MQFRHNPRFRRLQLVLHFHRFDNQQALTRDYFSTRGNKKGDDFAWHLGSDVYRAGSCIRPLPLSAIALVSNAQEESATTGRGLVLSFLIRKVNSDTPGSEENR